MVCVKEVDGLDDVGVLFSGREIRIVDNEVWLCVVSMVEGYWCDGKLILLVNDEGWFVMCDCGELNYGRLIIVGWLDNLFFSGGEGI